MKTKVNETTGVLEAFLPATILSINDSDVKTNSNGKGYKKCMVAVEYPDGTTDEIQSIFYTKSQIELPEVYKVQSRVELAIQIEGDYAGNSVVRAPELKRIDLGKLGININAMKIAAEA